MINLARTIILEISMISLFLLIPEYFVRIYARLNRLLKACRVPSQEPKRTDELIEDKIGDIVADLKCIWLYETYKNFNITEKVNRLEEGLIQRDQCVVNCIFYLLPEVVSRMSLEDYAPLMKCGNNRKTINAIESIYLSRPGQPEGDVLSNRFFTNNNIKNKQNVMPFFCFLQGVQRTLKS